jgi:hypothetical protein
MHAGMSFITCEILLLSWLSPSGIFIRKWNHG